MARKHKPIPATSPALDDPISYRAPSDPISCLPPREIDPPAAILHDRRIKVLQYYFHERLTDERIGALLGVSERTVERDKSWWRQQWRARYGDAPTFDPVEKIGETVAFFQQQEERALEEWARLAVDPFKATADRLKALTPSLAPDAQVEAAAALHGALTISERLQRTMTYQRMRVLEMITKCRDRQIAFLQDMGMLARNLGTLGVIDEAEAAHLRSLPTGERIAGLLRSLGSPLPADAMIPPGERGQVH